MATFLLIFLSFLISGNEEIRLSKKKYLYTNQNDSIPIFLKGNFKDDYGISYTINDTLWIQHPTAKYHILNWNMKEQYLIARNDQQNASEKGLYTRLDFMKLEHMEPWTWGFCLTVYDAANRFEAENKPQADRQNPKKGCNGFPFSRMKRN
jgi:hypothetical protein